MNQLCEDRSAVLPQQKTESHAYPFWTPRFWNGMKLRDWLRLVRRHDLDVHPLRWPMFLAVTTCTFFNSMASRIQELLYGGRIARTPIHDSPLFIIGHWRSGTTYLHELLSLDDRFLSPTTYQCFVPHHFLLTESILTRLVWIPSRRPMDNVKLGWKQPQEDEFAICIMGAPSPYARLAFPNHKAEYLEYLDMLEVGEAELRQWKAALVHFMRLVSYRNSKPLLLKSPTHTGRIATLLELFPKARFVHIVRDPFAVIPSTLRLWQTLESVQGLQMPKHQELVDYVFNAFDRMYRGFEIGRRLVGPRQMCTVHYEELVSRPIDEIAGVYDKLGLGDFERVNPRLKEYASRAREYRTNRYELSAPLREEISRRCAWYIERYGYSAERASA